MIQNKKIILTCGLLFCIVYLIGQNPLVRKIGNADGFNYFETYNIGETHDSKLIVTTGNGKTSTYDGTNFTDYTSKVTGVLTYSSKFINKGSYTLIRDINDDLIFHNEEFHKVERGPLLPLSGNTKYILRNSDSDSIFYYNVAQQKLIGEPTSSLNDSKPFTSFFENKVGVQHFYTKENQVVEHRVVSDSGIKIIKDKSVQLVDSMIIIWDDLSIQFYDQEFNELYSTKNQLRTWIRKFQDYKDRILALGPGSQDTSVMVLFDIKNRTTSSPIEIRVHNIDICTVNNSIFISGHEGLFLVDIDQSYLPGGIDNMVSKLHTIGKDKYGAILFGSYGSGFTILKDDKLSILRFDNNNINKALPGSYQMPNGDLLFFNGSLDQSISYWDGSTFHFPRVIDREGTPIRITGYYFHEAKDGTLYLGSNLYGIVQVIKLNKKEAVVKILDEFEFDNALTVCEDLAGNLWTGRMSRGTAVYSKKHQKYFYWRRAENNPKSFGIMSSYLDFKNNLWLGTNRGIYVLKNPHLMDFETEDLFEKAEKVFSFENENSWVAGINFGQDKLIWDNQQGINFLNLKKYYENPKATPIYTLWYNRDIKGDGGEQNCIKIYDNTLWIGSQTGVTKIDLDDLDFDTTSIEIELVAPEVSSSPNSYSEINIPFYARYLEAEFSTKHHAFNQNSIHYDILLTNEEGDTIKSVNYSPSGNFAVDRLNPGRYTLVAEAWKNGIKQKPSKHLVNVKPLLNERPWFYPLLTAFIIGAAAFFITMRVRAKRKLIQQELKLTKLKNDKNQLQIQAIISSFNPHFINNSLHYVQSKNRKDPEMVKLLGRLSNNIDYIFRQTRKGQAYHTLEEELRLTENYIIIQGLRFAGFKYIPPDSAVVDKLKEHCLFLMQIQIHVENAIEHGLRNRLDSSFVKVELFDYNERFEVHITDDGIGRPKAQQLNSHGTQNGTNMLKELQQIFNQNNDAKYQRRYEDEIFTDDKGKYGTRVILSIPKNFNYEL